MPATPTGPDRGTPISARARRRRFWSRFALALGTTLGLGSFAGCVAGVVPFGQLTGDERTGGVGEALDEALRRGDAAPLAAYMRRDPGARVCFVREFHSLRFPPLWNYWRTYGLPSLTVPDSHWAIAVLRAGRPPEFAVVRTQRLILSEGYLSCTGAGRLRLEVEWENRPGRPSLLRASPEP